MDRSVPDAITLEWLTVGDIAALFAVEPWKVRRLYLRGFLPEPMRAGPYRVEPAGRLPEIERALREAGYLDGAGDRKTGEG